MLATDLSACFSHDGPMEQGSIEVIEFACWLAKDNNIIRLNKKYLLDSHLITERRSQPMCTGDVISSAQYNRESTAASSKGTTTHFLV